MKTNRLLKSSIRTGLIMLLLFSVNATINSVYSQAFTHIWKGGTGDWGTTNWYSPHTTQGITVASGSTSVTLGAANANIAVGDYVAGYGIAPGTTVQSYPGTGTALTLSQAATAAISSTTVAFYKSNSNKGSAPTSTSLVLINSGTCTIQSGTAAVGRVFMGNTSATDQGNLVIVSGGSLTTSAAANNNTTNASLVIFGGKITINGGTLNANATGYTTVSYPVRFETPVIAPTVTWGIFGTGTFNINHQATAGTTGGAVIFNNTNTPSNAPEIDLNNATYTNAATGSTGFIGFTVSAGCNGIIGGAGLTIGTSGVPTVNNSALILLNQGSLTVNSGTTLNFYCASSTKNCISIQPTSGTTTFTNNGSISIGGTLAKAVYLNYGAANTGTINFTNAGSLTVNAAVTGTYSGALFMGGSASNTASININNSGTMSVTNTQTAGTGLGYGLYCANSTSVTTNTITNSGSLTIDGTLQSTGGVAGKTTINNTGTVTLNTTGLDLTVFNNNSGGILDTKTNTIASNSTYPVSIKAGSTFKTANTGGLNCISGTLPNGAVLESGANYVFNGTAAQTTGSTGTTGAALTANNIEIANSAGVTLSAATTANGALTLTSGKLTLGSNDLTASAISGGSSSNYVVTNGTGKLNQSVGAGTTVLFPIGASASSYDPATVTPTTATNFAVKVSSTLTNTVDEIATHAYINPREWTLTPALASSTSVTLKPSAFNALYAGAIYNVIGSGFGTIDGVNNYSFVSASNTSDAMTATFSSFNNPFVTGRTDFTVATLNPFAIKSCIYASVGSVTVDNADGKTVCIYNAAGNKLRSFNGTLNKTTIALEKGIYLISVDNKTQKVVVR